MSTERRQLLTSSDLDLCGATRGTHYLRTLCDWLSIACHKACPKQALPVSLAVHAIIVDGMIIEAVHLEYSQGPKNPSYGYLDPGGVGLSVFVAVDTLLRSVTPQSSSLSLQQQHMDIRD